MTYAPQSKDNSNPQHQQQTTKATAQTFSDNRESTAVSSPLQAMMANSPQQQKLKSTAQLMANSPVQQKLNIPTQNFANRSEPMQRMEEEEPLQGRFETESEPAQLEAASEAPRPNNTGLPDNLKSGIESLSGMSMDHVRVHYNSEKPAQLQAHAYAQGSEIHVAPGQEQHLPHEAWHVVQQAQGRVKPTAQMKGDVQVNDDIGLEAEADLMGGKAMQMVAERQNTRSKYVDGEWNAGKPAVSIIQRFFTPNVVGGYNAAQTYWAQAAAAVTAFDVALTAGGYASGSNPQTALLNTNAGLKANKARGTLAGEAFEPLNWDVGAPGFGAVQGPGAANGIDILSYDLAGGGPATDRKEVKSALNQNSAFSVIATAWKANPIILDHVELYYQGAFADFSVATLPINAGVAAFNRDGDDYYRVAGPACHLTVNIRNPVGGAIVHTVYFDVF